MRRGLIQNLHSSNTRFCVSEKYIIDQFAHFLDNYYKADHSITTETTEILGLKGLLKSLPSEGTPRESVLVKAKYVIGNNPDFSLLMWQETPKLYAEVYWMEEIIYQLLLENDALKDAEVIENAHKLLPSVSDLNYKGNFYTVIVTQNPGIVPRGALINFISITFKKEWAGNIPFAWTFHEILTNDKPIT